MRVAANHFIADTGDHVGEVECIGFACHVGMKKDLKEEVAQFLGQFLGGLGFDRIEDLIGFLDQVGAEARVCLLAIPRAATGGTESGLDSDQVREKLSNLRDLLF